LHEEPQGSIAYIWRVGSEYGTQFLKEINFVCFVGFGLFLTHSSLATHMQLGLLVFHISCMPVFRVLDGSFERVL
jgi:hypothetical protein